MKKKILSIALALCLIIPSIFMLTACGGKTPPNNGDIDTTPVLTTIRDLDVTVVKTAGEIADAVIGRH